MTYFSSDLHLNHSKPFVYEPRGFSSIDQMNYTILYNFHSKISKDDDLYLLGDTFLGDLDAGMDLFNQLPGKIHLIWGNHDTDNRKIQLATAPNVVEVLGFSSILKYKKYHFYLSHFPAATTNFDDATKSLKQRTLCLAGHTHSKEKFDFRTESYNVAVDAHNCYPISIDEVIEDFREYFLNKQLSKNEIQSLFVDH